MHYRRRLRTRIVVSFLLLGFGLTALFAMATVVLRNRLEGSLVDSWLQSEASNFMVFKRANREPDAPFTFARRIEAFAYRPGSAQIPFGWRDLVRGVYELKEYDDTGRLREYKLAVQREPDMVTYMRYDYTQEALTQRQMLTALGAAVFLFTGLAWVIGIWSSSRVISPLTELARRVEGLSSRDNPEKLAPHFPRDEVGELASALDDYAARMTSLVKCDRRRQPRAAHATCGDQRRSRIAVGKS
jgi:HAMP domain-containing protein